MAEQNCNMVSRLVGEKELPEAAGHGASHDRP